MLVAMHGRRRMTRLSHPYNAGIERDEVPPTRLALLAPSAKRREAFGKSREG